MRKIIERMSLEDPWNMVSYGLLLALLLLMVFTASDYGDSWDEDIRMREGELKFAYYRNLLTGDIKAAKTIGQKHDKYPGFHDLNLAVLRRISPLSDRATGNLFSAAFGLMAIGGAGLLAHRIGGSRSAFLTILLLASLPVFYGHLFINPKDIPFACGYIWALYSLTSWFSAKSLPPWKVVAQTGLIIGITTATRVGGLVLYCYLGFFVVVHLLSQIYAGNLFGEKAIVMELWRQSLRVGAVGIIAMVILLLYWPYGQMAPFAKTGETIEAITAFSWSMPVFFEGQFYNASDLPIYYILKMLFLKVPVLTLLAFLVGTGIVCLSCLRCLSEKKKFPFDKVVIVFSVLFPIAYVILRDSTLYNGIRHLLFILPPLCILAALAFDHLLVYLSKDQKHLVIPVSIAFAGYVALMIFNMVRLHPYQYIYYNALAGGTAHAAHNYETDYWCTVYKELGEEFLTYLETERPQFTKPEVVVNMEHVTWLLEPFIPRNTSLPIRIVRSSPKEDDYYVSSTAWAADRFYKGKLVLVVERMGTPLGVIKDRRTLPLSMRSLEGMP